MTPGAAFFFYNNAQHPHVESTLSARKVCRESQPGLEKMAERRAWQQA